MRKSLLLFSFFVSVLFLSAQNLTQRGIAKTLGIYTGGKIVSGASVSGAAITVKGGATAVSEKNGAFSFLAPSKSYYVSSIRKQGFSLVNTELTSRSHIVSDEPLTVLLLSINQQQKYEAEIRQKAQAAIQKEINKFLTQIKSLNSDIDALKSRESSSQSTIKLLEDERDKLQSQLISAQEQQEQKVKDMVEEYKALDFDALDDFYKEVKRLIIDGEYQRADSLLNTRGDLTAQVREQQEARAALEKREKDLAERCYSKYEIFAAQFQNDSAAYYLELRAALDTTNVSWQLDVGLFNLDVLDNSEKAKSHFQRALRQARKQTGENSAETAKCLVYLGAVSERQENYVSALDFYQQALNILRSVYGETHVDVALCLLDIGLTYRAQREDSIALEYFQQALEIDRTLFGERHEDVGKCLIDIGLTYADKGDANTAMDYYEQALDIFKSVLGENHPDVAAIYINMGSCLFHNIDNFAALDYYVQALDIYESNYGKGHLLTLIAMESVARAYDRIAVYEEALESYQELIQAEQTFYGENHPNIVNHLNRVGDIYVFQGNYAMALPYFQKAYDILSDSFVEDDTYIQYLKQQIEYIQELLKDEGN